MARNMGGVTGMFDHVVLVRRNEVEDAFGAPGEY
jgi:hypothetical protein